MLTIRYLLTLFAALFATWLVATATLSAIHNADVVAKLVASAIAVEKPAKIDTPISVRQYITYYVHVDRWILTDNPTGLPVYAVGFGNCPTSIRELLNKTYTKNNATIHATRCSLVMPWVDGAVITNYVATCSSGSNFEPEIAELTALYNNAQLTIRAVVINC